MDFLDALRERPLVADGAMGTMIYSKGVGFEHNFELLNLTHPISVFDHTDHRRRGGAFVVAEGGARHGQPLRARSEPSRCPRTWPPSREFCSVRGRPVVVRCQLPSVVKRYSPPR